MPHKFDTNTENEETYRAVEQPQQEIPEMRQQLEARIAAYEEMGLSAQDALADLKRQAREEMATGRLRQSTPGATNEFRNFVEMAGAVAGTSILMRLSFWLFLSVAAAGPGMRTIALWVMMACYFGIGYVVETLAPRRAVPAILIMVGLFLGVYGSELAFNGHLNILTGSFGFTFSLMGAGVSLLGAHMRRKWRARRAERRNLAA